MTAPLPRLLITADEAYPHFEALWLEAESRITAGFRVFDPETRLLSDEAREIGETWSDLVEHTLRRGIRVRLRIADFDPVARAALHRGTWSSLRRLWACGELSGRPELLDARAEMHPARSGALYGMAFSPLVRRKLGKTCDSLNLMTQRARDVALSEMPGLTDLVVRSEDGSVRPRRRLNHKLVPATHHQKLAVFDGKRLYIGGLDLDTRRFDSLDHDRVSQQTWHDVQVCLEGPVAETAEQHILSVRQETAALVPVGPRPGLLRTLSTRNTGWLQRIGPCPGLTEINDLTLAEIKKSERLIYLETQFFRDLRLARAMAARARARPELGLILILPAAPEEVAFENARGLDSRFGEHLQAKCLAILRKAFGDRLFIGSPARPHGLPPDGSRAVLEAAPIIYVHAKVSVFDDRCALVTSANLNGRSLRWDTEAGIAQTDPEIVREWRTRLMQHWLPQDADQAYLKGDDLPKTWRALAQANADLPPAQRRGFLLPYPAHESRRFGRPLPFMPHDMV